MIQHTLGEGYSEAEDGNILCRVECGTCDNIFYVIQMPENAPSCCCYCGTKFDSFDIKT